MKQKKNWKTLALGLVSVVALGVATFAGLSQEAETALQTGLEAVVTGVFTIIGAWAVHKNHDKPHS